MPPRETKERVNLLSLLQINFQRVNFLFWLNFFLFFAFFPKMFTCYAYIVRLSLNVTSALC